jgi:hypothetical protein
VAFKARWLDTVSWTDIAEAENKERQQKVRGGWEAATETEDSWRGREGKKVWCHREPEQSFKEEGETVEDRWVNSTGTEKWSLLGFVTLSLLVALKSSVRVVGTKLVKSGYVGPQVSRTNTELVLYLPQWCGPCLAWARPWVWSPAPHTHTHTHIQKQQN